MSMTDPLGDMLTRIRNGQRAGKRVIAAPASKLRSRVLDVLQREGFIRGYSEAEITAVLSELPADLPIVTPIWWYAQTFPTLYENRRIFRA